MTRWASPETLAAAKSGDEDAREALIAAIWPGCYRLAASVIGDATLASVPLQQ